MLHATELRTRPDNDCAAILHAVAGRKKTMTTELTLEQMLAALIPNDDSAEVSVELDADSLSSISAPSEVASQEETQILKRLILMEWPGTAESDA
jgi:hypothetical protein